MSNFEVLVVGAGDTFSEQHWTSALVLSADGVNLAIDCPDRYRAALRAQIARSGRQLELAEIDRVLITHVHGDHMNGLEGVAFYKRFAEGRRLELISSPEVRASIWDQRLAAPMGTLWDGEQHRTMNFGDYFQHTALDWSGAIEVGPFRIRARRTIHHVPTSALLIEAGGRTLGYSGDTAFDPELIAFLAPADLIIHETNFGPAHTPYASLAALPAELRRKMRLIHYPDGFDAAHSAIPALVEGDRLRP
jgi:ribonuclease BN (tRNA processing enzyme)